MLVDFPETISCYTLFTDLQLFILLCSGLKIGDEVTTFIRLLQTSEDHLGSGNIFLGVLEVLEEGVFVPGDSLEGYNETME